MGQISELKIPIQTLTGVSINELNIGDSIKLNFEEKQLLINIGGKENVKNIVLEDAYKSLRLRISEIQSKGEYLASEEVRVEKVEVTVVRKWCNNEEKKEYAEMIKITTYLKISIFKDLLTHNVTHIEQERYCDDKSYVEPTGNDCNK